MSLAEENAATGLERIKANTCVTQFELSLRKIAIRDCIAMLSASGEKGLRAKRSARVTVIRQNVGATTLDSVPASRSFGSPRVRRMTSAGAFIDVPLA
jgi:hypothetical protein